MLNGSGRSEMPELCDVYFLFFLMRLSLVSGISVKVLWGLAQGLPEGTGFLLFFFNKRKSHTRGRRLTANCRQLTTNTLTLYGQLMTSGQLLAVT